ncbi:MAG: hypothetical protein WBI17_05315 [Clostridiaceae bacterium]
MKPYNKVKWTRMDNASKIFPATSNNRDTKVFRFACELYDEVDPSILQKALDITLEGFPLFKSVLRRGFFWYYFEASDIMPLVEIESNPVCAPLYIKDKKSLLFRLFYFKNRINLEVFHALTDGAGVIWFMETLVYHYMTIKYKDIFPKDISKINYKASISQKMSDSFEKNYRKGSSAFKKPRLSNGKAYQMRGTKVDENRTKLIEGAMSAKAVLELAHEYKTTLTIFLTSLFFYSIQKDMPSKMKKKPVVLSVPINLRQYFESYTARNFFSTMNVSYDFENKSTELSDIIISVTESFKEGLSMENLNKHLAELMSLEKNPIARIIPLTLKDYALKIANVIADRGVTSSISNIGRIVMPPEFTPYIHQFSICVSARRPQIVLCSYGDRLVISFTSPFQDTDVQRIFFQFLTGRGIDVEITTNL